MVHVLTSILRAKALAERVGVDRHREKRAGMTGTNDKSQDWWTEEKTNKSDVLVLSKGTLCRVNK